MVSHISSVVSANLSVTTNTPVGDSYWHLRLNAPPIHTAALPGQFFHLQCPPSGNHEPYLRRPMSVYGTNNQLGEIEFLYKVTGIGTQGLATLRPGDLLNALGPLGNGFTIDPSHQHVLGVARGVGLATISPLSEALAAANNSLTIICSFRNPDAAIGLEAFNATGAAVIAVYDSDGSSSVERVAAQIKTIHESQTIDAAYTCGSHRLSEMLRSLGKDLDFATQVALEERMACALGMCHACVIECNGPEGPKSQRICTTGPVFDLEQVR